MTMLQNGGAATPARRWSDQGHHHPDLHEGRDRGVEAPAGAGRLLGAVVRPLQAAHPGARKGGQGRQGQGQARQDEHRQASGDSGPAGHPVDPGGDRLRQRPAGRRLHGRAAGEPGHGLHRAADQGQDRRRGEGPARGRRRGAGGGRCRRRRRDLRAGAGRGPRQRRRRSPASRAAMSATGALEQAKQTLALVPEAKRNDAAVAAARAALELAEQANSVGPIGELEQKVAANPLDHQARFDLAVALNASGKRAGGGRPSARDRQARPQMERGRRAQAARAVLRGLGPDRRGDASRAASGCRRSCSRESLRHPCRRAPDAGGDRCR